MENRTINSWGEFVALVEELHAGRDACADHATASVSELLYRGQPDSRMELSTTLDRLVSHEITLRQYYRFVSVIKAKIESFTGKIWTIPSLEEFDEWFEGQLPHFGNLPGYTFLAYLRHHGLPSPLLDWTRSPYIAAHFALASPPSEGVQNAVVYVYLESADGFKIGDIDAPTIQHLGPYVNTHRRHYLQQSEYTICTTRIERALRYTSHEKVVARNDKGQDLLWKLIIPISARREFIEQLQRMNINPFSLFETEDKLMEEIYLSEIFLRNRLNSVGST